MDRNDLAIIVLPINRMHLLEKKKKKKKKGEESSDEDDDDDEDDEVDGEDFPPLPPVGAGETVNTGASGGAASGVPKLPAIK